LLAGAPGGPLLMFIASLVMVAVFVEILRRQAATFTAIMALGAVAWAVGQLLWLAGEPVHRVVLWWAAFLVLTIAAERLEMTRLVPRGPSTRATFVVAIAALLLGLAYTSLSRDGAAGTGVRIVGASWIALAAWLGAFDIARRTVRMSGVPRFTAVALLSGYAWLAVAGGLALAWGDVAAGPLYDAILHAVFVGFVFSMIFGHAPIIIPAVLRRGVRYHPVFYVHVAVLHASLVLRVAGDAVGWTAGRQWGGLVNVLAIVLFIGSTAVTVVRNGWSAAPG
jgi:hypothetical protein